MDEKRKKAVETIRKALESDLSVEKSEALKKILTGGRQGRADGDGQEKKDDPEKTLKEILETETGAAFLEFPSLRLDRHFKIQPDLLIYDNHLGSLGLIHILELPEKNPTEVEEIVNRHVDRAAYARHLLLTDPNLEDRLPLTVDVVLAVPGDDSARSFVEKAFWKIMRDTSFLNAVGVHILPLRRREESYFLDEKSIQRAFSWMLRATGRWYDQFNKRDDNAPDDNTAGSSSESEGVDKLGNVNLFNYRLPGHRILELDKDYAIHVVHGHNGSGKSSIVEALEFVITGSVERIKGEESNYETVIRHHGSDKPAEIVLEFQNGREAETYKIGENGLEPTRVFRTRAESFRLDQSVMDRLCRYGDVQRAETFLGSFFPGDEEKFTRYHRARRNAERAFLALPVELQKAVDGRTGPDGDRETKVIERFGWLNMDGHPEGARPEDCLPLPLETLKELLSLAPEMKAPLDDWTRNPPAPKALPRVLQVLDDALEGIKKNQASIQHDLRIAGDRLRELNRWRVTGEGGAESMDYVTDLNSWLELRALTDLAEKHRQLAAALLGAGSRGWSLEREGAQGLFKEGALRGMDPGALEKTKEAWKVEMDQLYRKLSEKPEEDGAGGATPIERPRFSPAHMEILDRVGDWLFPSYAVRDGGRLGQCIAESLAGDRLVEFGGVSIGKENWAGPLIKKLAPLEKALARLDALGPASSWMNGTERYNAIEHTLDQYKESRLAGEELNRTFLARISADLDNADSDDGLNAALNELMALFTPTRWNYDDVSIIHHTESDGRQTVGMRMDENGNQVKADLRLNTAELNLFTIALFLLCAFRVENPLHLLVLDDPLQNMDELTTTTMARGLAKIARLWRRHLPDSWQLLMLFHGEDDMERFRREISCAAYLLPGYFLEKDGHVMTRKDARKSRRGDRIQELDGVMEIMG